MQVEHIVSVSSSLNGVRISDIWNQITQFEKYAEYIPEVDKVNTLTDNRSEWFISLDSAPFTWVEVDTFDSCKYRLDFNSVGGDFEDLHGCWRIFRDASNQIKLCLELDYYLGFPVLEDLINNVLKQKMQIFADSMVRAHSERVQILSKNTRMSDRYVINISSMISINGRPVEAHIINLSNGGIMFILNKEMDFYTDSGNTTINVDSLQITGNLQYDTFLHIHRMVFNKKLSDKLFISLLSGLNNQCDLNLVKVFEVLTSEQYTTSDTITSKK